MLHEYPLIIKTIHVYIQQGVANFLWIIYSWHFIVHFVPGTHLKSAFNSLMSFTAFFKILMTVPRAPVKVVEHVRMESIATSVLVSRATMATIVQ